jgi:endonuclease-3
MNVKFTALQRLPKMLSMLRREVKQWKQPIVGTFAEGENALFKVLISTVLSLRTKDRTTEEASHRLFREAQTPEALLKLDQKKIEELIFPVGFYHTKAKNLRRISELLLERHQGRVPDTMEELLALPGVGRKTANLVVTVGYGRPGICVDTHVHRISNRWGLVKTNTPEETEMALRNILPKRYWIEYNDLLVCFGQNLCQPVSPHCSRCKLQSLCPKIGVKRSR